MAAAAARIGGCGKIDGYGRVQGWKGGRVGDARHIQFAGKDLCPNHISWVWNRHLHWRECRQSYGRGDWRYRLV